MSDAYGSAAGLREVCHDIRQPIAGVLSGGYGLGLSAVARQAVRHRGRLECGRGSLGGGRVSLWLPLAASRMQRRPANATCAV
jgi:nitrogen-specific signal transduction histidine kinase